jgi:uridine phosphorylase
VRIGTCVGSEANGLGDLLIVEAAIARGGSAASLGVEPGTAVAPDPVLTGELRSELGNEARLASVESVDADPAEHRANPGVAAIDMQTAPLLARAITLQIELAAMLIVSETEHSAASLPRETLEELERRAGRAASLALSG